MASGVAPGVVGQETAKVSTLCELKPGLTLQSLAKAADHQPRTHQQHQRHRHFDDHEEPLQPVPRAARPASPFFQRCLQARARGSQRGRQSEEDPRQQRRGQSKQQNPRIDVHGLRARQRIWHQPDCRLRPPRGQQQTQAAPGAGKYQALGEKLANHSSLARAQRRANCEFASAPGRARQKQISHIHARNQENESHRGQQHQQKRPDVAHHVLFE